MKNVFYLLTFLVLTFSSCDKNDEKNLDKRLLEQWLWLETTVYQDSIEIHYDTPASIGSNEILELKENGKYSELYSASGPWDVDRTGEWYVNEEHNVFSLIYDKSENDVRNHVYSFSGDTLITVYNHLANYYEHKKWIIYKNE